MNRNDLLVVRRRAVYKLKSDLVDLVLIIFAFISMPAVFGSLIRIKDIGIIPIMYIHIVIALIIILVAVFRKKISLKKRVSILLISLMIIGSLFLQVPVLMELRQ